MRFDLTAALIDDILFSMEDQEGEFLVDTYEGAVAGGLDFKFDEDQEERFIPLPGWDSSDGYHLMEHFTAALRNPLIREELTGALNQGKGVFRAFKDTLSRYPEMEKRWFSYKEREMKRKIIRWYNGLREEWGLERIGGEPEETGELLLEDFRFHKGGEQDLEAVMELYRLCLEEPEAGLPGDKEDGVFPGDLSLVAETGGGEPAGFVSGRIREGSLHITALVTGPEYRGLGIGEALLSRMVEAAVAQNLEVVSLDLPAPAEGFSRVLLREAFRPCMTRYHLLLKKQGNDHLNKKNIEPDPGK